MNHNWYVTGWTFSFSLNNENVLNEIFYLLSFFVFFYQKEELFEANREEVVEQANWINCEKVVSLLETVMNSTLDTTVHQHTRNLYEDLLEKYTSFMKSSNHFDAVDVFKTFLTELLKTDSALFKDVSSVHFEFHGKAPDLLQVYMFRLQQLCYLLHLGFLYCILG